MATEALQYDHVSRDLESKDRGWNWGGGGIDRLGGWLDVE